MAITGVSNYNSVYESTYATSGKEVAKKEETKETTVTQKSTETAKKSSNEKYLKTLQKQVPYMTLEVGSSLSMARDNRVNVLTINPKLLEKMQNDPEKAKECTQQLKAIESATKWLDGYMKSRGIKTEYSHCYIDENGNFTNVAHYVSDNTFREKLAKERQENSEKLIEKTREKARKNAEKMAEKAEKSENKLENEAEKKVVKEDETTTPNKAEQLLEEKIASSKDGTIYLYDTDMQTIIEAAKEDNAGKANTKQQAQVGANMDLQA